MADAGILGVECSVCMNRPVQVSTVFQQHAAGAWLTLVWNLVLAGASISGCIDSRDCCQTSFEASGMLMYRCRAISHCVFTIVA